MSNEMEIRDMSVIDEVAAERKRQVHSEGFNTAHDDDHDVGELALAAALYATPINLYRQDELASGVQFVDPWPWASEWDKREWDDGYLLANRRAAPKKRRRMLIQAAALIVAEIERLDRAALSAAKE